MYHSSRVLNINIPEMGVRTAIDTENLIGLRIDNPSEYIAIRAMTGMREWEILRIALNPKNKNNESIKGTVKMIFDKIIDYWNDPAHAKRIPATITSEGSGITLKMAEIPIEITKPESDKYAADERDIKPDMKSLGSWEV